MGRAIVTATATASTTTTIRRGGIPDGDEAPSAPAPISAPSDEYGDRLLKLIPGEIISAYLSIIAMLTSRDEPVKEIVAFGAVAIFAGLTYLYLRVTLKVDNIRQLLVSVVAFCVWAMAIGKPFSDFCWYDGMYAGIALAMFTLISPMIPMEAEPQSA